MNHDDVTISIICYTALQKCERLMTHLLTENSGARFILTANGNNEVGRYFNRLRSQHPTVHIEVIHNQLNQGFIAPSNLAFALTSTDFYVALNDDALPPANWLAMLKVPFADPLMAVTGARGTCQTLDEQFIGRPGEYLDYIEASCMMVRRSLMPKPLFPKELRFGYGEDAWLCLELREKGYKIAQADFKLVEHFRNSTSRLIPGIRHIMTDNFAKCRKRWATYLKYRVFVHEENAP